METKIDSVAQMEFRVQRGNSLTTQLLSGKIQQVGSAVVR